MHEVLFNHLSALWILFQIGFIYLGVLRIKAFKNKINKSMINLSILKLYILWHPDVEDVKLLF
jgi:hypothetical protein